MPEAAGTAGILRAIPRERATWWAPSFVWTVCALLLVAALAFVAEYGHNVPLWDDYVVLPFLTGDISVNPTSLWEQYNEHRIPLPKFILLGLLFASGGDFRAGMFFNVLTLGGLALGMICAAKRIRGWTSCTDAFFPLILLHPGNGENFLWCWQVVQIIPTVLAGTLLLCLVRLGSLFPLRLMLVVSFCLILLSLSGPPGMAYVPSIALEISYLGVLSCRSHRKRISLLISLLGCSCLLLLLFYFIGYEKNASAQSSPNLWASGRTGIQFLGMIFGFKARDYWPLSGLILPILGLISASVLVVAWYQRSQERPRALGLLFFLTATAALAASVGWGRAGFGHLAGFQMRYVTLTAPALCCVYFCWTIYTRPAVNGWGRVGFLLLAGFILMINIRDAVRFGNARGQKMAALERDLRLGVPPYRLARRYTPFLQHSHDAVTWGLQTLHRAGVGPFRCLQEDPPFVEIPLALEPTVVNHMTWEQGTGQGTGQDSYLEFMLPKPTFVAGIRITYVLANRNGTTAFFKIFWKRCDQPDFSEQQSYMDQFLGTGPEENVETIYPCDEVGHFRLYLDNKPFHFRISAILLLVPKTGAP